MANSPVNGKQFVIMTRTGTGSPKAFETVVCLTSNGFQPTDNQIDASSKCTDGWATTIPGDKGWSITGDAQAITGTLDAGTASHKKFLNLWKTGEVFEAMIVDADDTDNVEVRGNVRVTDIPLTYPNNDLATFSLTLTGQGEPFFEAEA
jgi:predicted secreted protein